MYELLSFFFLIFFFSSFNRNFLLLYQVGPQAIYVVGRDDDETIAAESYGSDAASWETVDDEIVGTVKDVNEVRIFFVVLFISYIDIMSLIS